MTTSQNPSLSIRNTKELDHTDLFELGRERFDLVNQSGTLARLASLDRYDTIRRTRNRKMSRDTLLATAQDESMDAFVITETSFEKERLIGMATLQPNLDLRLQVAPGPTRLVRKLAQLGGMPGFSKPISMNGLVNAAAWVRPVRYSQEVREISSIFRHLRHQRPDATLWTLLQDERTLIGYHYGLIDAGFDNCPPKIDPLIPTHFRFDDYSAVGLHQAQKSFIYSAFPLIHNTLDK